ncbi:MAG: hypothetical protein U1D97_00415, partial [Desulfuromonadales bacterium]|nr:hypothetical protein [Desulfuromonadales bacterium]
RIKRYLRKSLNSILRYYGYEITESPLCANVSETLPPFEFRVYNRGGKERYNGEEGSDVVS